MQSTATPYAGRSLAGGQRRRYRVERKFSTTRQPEELVRDLLRAHCGA